MINKKMKVLKWIADIFDYDEYLYFCKKTILAKEVRELFVTRKFKKDFHQLRADDDI